jgi:tyrosine-protein kinase Etk/Wzc
LTAGVEPGSKSIRRSGTEDISFFELLTPIVRRWKTVVGTALACGVVAAIFLLVQRPVYTAQTNFTPETPSNSGLASSLAGLAGLAGQLGIGSNTSAGVSPEFFARLLQSRELLRSVLLTEFDDPKAQGTKHTLLDLTEVPGRNLEERLQIGARHLTSSTEATVDKSTGIVTLEVEMYSPVLAAAVANRMIELLNKFNLERRQSQSHEQRRFAGDRLAAAEQELRDAERAQLRFLQTNRQYVGSPMLEFQAAQLERAVQVKQEVFLTLTKAFEEARIAEVRDTPVLTVVDPAVAPARRTRPKRVLGTTLAMLAGGMLGIIAVYVGAFRNRVRRDSAPDYVDFQAAWDEARGRSRRLS